MAVEKVKFDLSKPKLEGEVRLATINSGRFLAVHTTSDGNNQKIGKIPYEIFVLTPQFPDLPPREMSKIYQNRFRPFNIYKLRHFKGRNNIYQDQIAVKNNPL